MARDNVVLNEIVRFEFAEHVPNYMATVSSASEPSTSGTEDANMKFIDTINPMLSFSNDDLEAMNKDVEDFFDSDSSSDDSVDIGSYTQSRLSISAHEVNAFKLPMAK